MAEEKNMFVEQDCTFEVAGKTFESGGSYLVPGNNGKLQGILYHFSDGSIGTWHGDKKVTHVRYGHEWRSNAGDTRQSVYLTWDGIPLYGIYFKSSSDIVRVRQIKR